MRRGGGCFLEEALFPHTDRLSFQLHSPIPATHEPCALVPSHVSLPLVPGRVSLLPSEQVAVWDIQPLFSPVPRHLLRLQISAPLSPPLSGASDFLSGLLAVFCHQRSVLFPSTRMELVV